MSTVVINDGDRVPDEAAVATRLRIRNKTGKTGSLERLLLNTNLRSLEITDDRNSAFQRPGIVDVDQTMNNLFRDLLQLNPDIRSVTINSDLQFKVECLMKHERLHKLRIKSMLKYEEVELMANLITKCTMLTHLELKNIADCGNQLIKAIGIHPSITHLTVSSHYGSTGDFDIVKAILSCNPRITHLIFPYARNVRYLSEYVSKHHPNLTFTCLRSDRYSVLHDDDIEELYFNACLELSYNHQTRDDMIFNNMSELDNVTSFSIGTLSDDLVPRLIQTLHANPQIVNIQIMIWTVTKLDLLSDLLTAMSDIVRLDIQYVTDSNIEPIKCEIRKFPKLNYLKLPILFFPKKGDAVKFVWRMPSLEHFSIHDGQYFYNFDTLEAKRICQRHKHNRKMKECSLTRRLLEMV